MKAKKQQTDAQKTSHPPLPFTREADLEDEVVKMLSGIPHHYSAPMFSVIPAIKHVRAIMNWGLWEAKEYVDKIYQKHVDKIEAARVLSLKRWNKEQMKNERIQEL